MTSPFGKRVDILTDWHNRFPDANVDLLAELVLDVWQQTENHIVGILNDPIYDGLSRAHLIGVIQGASLDSEWD